MLYKTVGFAAASAVCALMVGCANTTTGKMVEPLEVMPTEVCIIQNPKVTSVRPFRRCSRHSSAAASRRQWSGMPRPARRNTV